MIDRKNSIDLLGSLFIISAYDKCTPTGWSLSGAAKALFKQKQYLP